MENYVFIENNKLRISPSTKLIKAKSYTSISTVEDILKKARERADVILSSAQKNSELIKERAENAYELEKERGYQEGIEKGQREMATKITSTILKSEEYIHAFEEKIIALVLYAVRKIIDEMEKGEMIRALVKKSLSVMKNQKQIKLKVSPVHVDYLNMQIAEILSSYPNIDGIEILADERLSQNQLILDSPIGIVDASIDTQLAAISDAFSRCFHHKSK